MSPTSPDLLQVRVDTLASLYTGLAAALSESEFTPGQRNEILSQRVHAQCVQCGIHVTGEDISRVALATESASLRNPKLDRLRQGYCARNGCDSLYYRVHLGDYPNLDWVKIRKKADSLPVAPQTDPKQGSGTPSTAARKRLLIRVGAGVALAGVLLLWRQYLYYGYLPLLKRPHKYTVDPASAGPPHEK